MGLLDLFRRPEARVLAEVQEIRDDLSLDAIRRAPRGGKTTSAVSSLAPTRPPPPRRTATTIQAAYRTSPWLRSICGRLADMVAATAWEVGYPQASPRAREDLAASGRDGGFVARRRSYRDPQAMAGNVNRMRRLKQAGAWAEVPDHPMLDLLEAGNPYCDGPTIRKASQLHKDLAGEFFWLVQARGRVPEAIWVVPPGWVERTPSASEPSYKIRSPFSGSTVTVAAEFVIWVKDPDPENPYGRGVGLGESLGDEIDTDQYAATFLKSFFVNGTSIDGIVSLENASEDEVEQIETEMNDRFRGADKARKLAFTTGKLNFQPLGTAFKDLPISELRKDEREAIRQVLGVPPEVMGDAKDSNRATIWGAETILAKYALVPRLGTMRVAVQRLAAFFDDRLVAMYVSPVPEDKDFKLQAMKTAPKAFTVAEARELAGYEARPGDEDETLEPAAVAVPMPGGLGGGDDDAEPADDGPDQVEDDGTDDDKAMAAARPVRMLPALRKSLSADALDLLVAALRPERIAAELVPAIRGGLRAHGNDVLRGLGATFAFDMINPEVVRHLEELAGERVTGINDTTRDMLRASLAEGRLEGEGVDATERRIRGLLGPNSKEVRARGRMIARTEITHSAGFGSYSAFAQSGVVDGKQWLGTNDDVIRETHDDLDGTIVDLREFFETPNGKALYCGGFGVPEEDINCRCAIAPVISGKALADPRVYWKRIDLANRAWERDVARAVRAGLARQLGDVLARLRAVT